MQSLLADPPMWHYGEIHRGDYFSQPLQVYTPPCSCDCADMVRPANVAQGDPSNFVQLFGGGENPYHCQRIELNISACNNQAISSIPICFNGNESDCFNQLFKIKREDGEDCGAQFNPLNQCGTLCIYPPIPACSSRKVIFYVCGSITDCCCTDGVTLADVTLDLSHVGGCSNRAMTFRWDKITGSGIVNPLDAGRDNSKELQHNSIKCPQTFNYKIIDIYGTSITSGTANSINDVKA